MNGPERPIKTIMIFFPHKTPAPSQPEPIGGQDGPSGTFWVAEAPAEWFPKMLQGFGFSKSGHFKEIGFKYGRSIDVSVFQYTTREPITAGVFRINATGGPVLFE